MLQAQVQYYIYTLILFYYYFLFFIFFAVDEFCITNKPWDSSWAL